MGNSDSRLRKIKILFEISKRIFCLSSKLGISKHGEAVFVPGEGLSENTATCPTRARH